MGLRGSAFLAIWHDIAEGQHGEYIEWHTREHMPERLAIPGFRTGKRLHAPDAERYIFGTIYSGDTVDVFRSPAYLERLNNPTPWTAAVAPSFQNFLRIACEKIASAGTGDGGSMATIRFDFAGDGASDAFASKAQPLPKPFWRCAAHAPFTSAFPAAKSRASALVRVSCARRCRRKGSTPSS